MECASMLAVSKYRKIPFVQFLYGADNLSSEKWEMRDLELYGLTNAEKYMLLAFEIGLALYEGGYRYGLKYDFKQYITRRNTIFL